jgi:hypothetical protein
MPDDWWERLTERATAEGMSVSSYIQQLIQRRINDDPARKLSDPFPPGRRKKK